jgi:excisionase family DNA binding protein
MTWLSAAEAADIMRCSEQTLIKMAKEGQFPTAKWAGKKVRIHESDLRPETAAPSPAPVIDAGNIGRLIMEIQHRLHEIEDIVNPDQSMTSMIDDLTRTAALMPTNVTWAWTKQG